MLFDWQTTTVGVWLPVNNVVFPADIAGDSGPDGDITIDSR